MKLFCEVILVIVPWLMLSLLVILYEDVIARCIFKFIVYITDVLNRR
ncbi:hypothetical protein SEEN443_14522 [Salmonella enterica subsp. enterica serovar Newport str. CVM 19443]|nr:hypothetical protein SEEN443_14522 [Salmonella enterica subsp. enterica serovar Newport str. CVM 19443]